MPTSSVGPPSKLRQRPPAASSDLLDSLAAPERLENATEAALVVLPSVGDQPAVDLARRQRLTGTEQDLHYRIREGQVRHRCNWNDAASEEGDLLTEPKHLGTQAYERLLFLPQEGLAPFKKLCPCLHSARVQSNCKLERLHAFRGSGSWVGRR